MLNMKELLEDYQNYLIQLVESKSSEIFTNGGIEHAAILMATLFDNTNNQIRMFCHGLKPQLFETGRYKDAVVKYLDYFPYKTIRILVETEEYLDQKPFSLFYSQKLVRIKREKAEKLEENSYGKSIEIKVLRETDKDNIFKELSTNHCNFSVFDDDKFRLEIDPENYRAIGSFNSKGQAKVLITLFDDAFNNAKEVEQKYIDKVKDDQELLEKSKCNCACNE